MSITTFDPGYIAALKQVVHFFKNSAYTTGAGIPFTTFHLGGSPGAGVLNVGNTANGIVPTDAITGYPPINAISGIGYLTRVSFGNTVASRMAIYDRLFSAGAYAFNANVTLASQPSFSSRVPDGDYKGLGIWLEAVTAFTGLQSIRITYLDQDGNLSNTGVVLTGGTPIVGRMFNVPLAAGDTGVQQIVSVISSVSTAGTFNVHIMRKLWEGRVLTTNFSDVHDLLKTGMPQVFDDSALMVVVQTDGSSGGVPFVDIEIAQA